MLPPLVRAMLEEPGLFTGYVKAYAVLFKQDAAWWRTKQVRRLVNLAALVGGGFFAVLFGGVALMMFAVTGVAHWLLWAVPVAPALVALVAAWRLRHPRPESEIFPRVREQVAQDMRLFSLKERTHEPAHEPKLQPRS
ncbi:hypothetical protein Tbd_2241 [Thiobacillus denitrificans ATCC 25259]|uniref:Transmembrane protein n=1 Tax=Thiobacillus denitrificans (strain ATCC 25259 / T1) TaxID=292415 RepID=Q3SGQ3_THIDA|nr:hypothetical protein [Thiobacillus denitrificans]AAZ98194.1 hypothetical protein Tbd_2241 [Thiobacillus denitrificans ATCC 25259]